MAEPTLNDVLDAVAKIDAKVTRLEKGQAEIRSEMNQRFDRVDEAIAELDADLDRHMKVHKDIDKRLDALKPRPGKVTARVPRRR